MDIMVYNFKEGMKSNMSKKQIHAERNTAKKAETAALRERLENYIVLQTSIVLVLAVLFAVFNNYLKSGTLTGGMMVLCDILMWLGVAAVLVFAVLGYVKKDKSLFKLCGAGLANAAIWSVFYRFGSFKGHGWLSGVAVSYYAIALYFIFCLVYYLLAMNKKWNKKGVRIAFFTVASIVALALVIGTIVLMYLGGNLTGFAK